MLISVEPIHLAMKDIADFENAYKILTSPSGVLLNQKKVETLRKYNHFIIICGHYEGIDARILEYVDEEKRNLEEEKELNKDFRKWNYEK